MARFRGLDLHKNYVHGCGWIPGQEKGRHVRFPNTQEAWQRFLASSIHQDRWVALEVTGNALRVYDWLQPHAGQVVLANPVEVKRLGSGRHTDRVDAERLAKMLALGTLPTVWVPPRPIRGLWALVGYRDKLVRQRIRYQNQARAVLTRGGHKVPRNADIRRWLLEHPDALPQAYHDRLVLSSAARMLAMIDRKIRQLESAIAVQASQAPEIRLTATAKSCGHWSIRRRPPLP